MRRVGAPGSAPSDPHAHPDDIIQLRSAARSRRPGVPTAPLIGIAAACALVAVAGGAWQILDPAPDVDLHSGQQAAVARASLDSGEESVERGAAAPPVASAPPAAAPASRKAAPAAFIAWRVVPAETVADYLARAEALLQAGDLAAARLFFERVAEAGDARGALGLARSHDPEELRRLPVHGHAGDVSTMHRWRAVAKTMGGVEEAR